MPLIDWIPSYNVGIIEIDIDNKQLVGMINLLHDSISKQKNQEIVNQVVSQLAQNFKDHCTSSNHELLKINYPAISQQQESHKRFGQEIAKYLQRIKNNDKISTMELIAFLRNWFEKHILIEDKKIKVFLKKNNSNKIHNSELAKSKIKKIVWKDSYLFENKKIDSQHKGLVDLFNKLFQAVELQLSKTDILKIVSTFKHQAEKHFKDEEQLMIECSYDKYDEHTKIHRQLIKEFNYFIKRITDDNSISYIKILTFIHNWFINHFTVEDDKLFKFMRSNKELTNQE